MLNVRYYFALLFGLASFINAFLPALKSFDSSNHKYADWNDSKNTVMWKRRRRTLDEELFGIKEPDSKWTKVSGISLPDENGKLKGWELDFGKKKLRITVGKDNGRYYALEGACPRCAFDLWKGDILEADEVGPARVSCPLCGACYGLSNGSVGEPLKRGGFQGWLGGLAQAATATSSASGVKTVPIKVVDGETMLDLHQFM